MSSNSKVIVFQLVQIAKNSSLLKKQITKIENKIVDTGLSLIEDAGINVDEINKVVDLKTVLRGEGANLNINAILTPEIICSQPTLSVEQKEQLTRKISEQKEKIEGIYTSTNNIALQLESIKTPIVRLQDSIQPATDTVELVNDLIQVLKQIPVPSAAPPGIGLPISIFNTFSDILNNLSDTSEAMAANLSIIPDALGGMVQMVNSVGIKLQGVNKVIDPFLKLLTMVKSIVDLQDQCVFGLDQSQIDEIQANLSSDILGSVAQFTDIANYGDALLESLQPNANPPFFYKNFKFTLETDSNNEFFFPGRRIRCFKQNSTGYYDGNTAGVGGEEINFGNNLAGGGSITIFNINEQTQPDADNGSYSYGSNLQFLISQAKLAFDVYINNITAFTRSEINENQILTSTSGSYSTGYSIEEGQVVSQFLPNYILYGGTNSNLNNSPSNIEYGADRLAVDGDYKFGSGIEFGSYIVTGTLQVNKPINIKLKTFGGTGNPIRNNDGVLTPRFTESLLTFKRSAAIQDNINPFTGKIVGFNQDDVDNFIAINGINALKTLNLINEVSNETNTSIGYATDETSIKDLKFIEKLENVFNRYYGIDTETEIRTFDVQPGNDDTGTFEAEVDIIQDRETTGPITEEIRDLFAKSSELVNNKDVLYTSKTLFGFNESKVANRDTIEFANTILDYDENYSAGSTKKRSDGQNKTYKTGELGLSVTEKISSSSDWFTSENWYWTANKAFNNSKVNNTWQGQVAALSMLLFALRQFGSEFTTLYGNNPDYNNGAWEAPGFGIPLIPTNVTADNEDITEALLATQLAGVGETINEVVGGLTILGTYTYSLEIIDSIPKIGGIETDFPTNYTTFTIEDIIPNNTPSIETSKNRRT